MEIVIPNNNAQMSDKDSKQRERNGLIFRTLPVHEGGVYGVVFIVETNQQNFLNKLSCVHEIVNCRERYPGSHLTWETVYSGADIWKSYGP